MIPAHFIPDLSLSYGEYRWEGYRTAYSRTCQPVSNTLQDFQVIKRKVRMIEARRFNEDDSMASIVGMAN